MEQGRSVRMLLKRRVEFMVVSGMVVLVLATNVASGLPVGSRNLSTPTPVPMSCDFDAYVDLPRIEDMSSQLPAYVSPCVGCTNTPGISKPAYHYTLGPFTSPGTLSIGSSGNDTACAPDSLVDPILYMVDPSDPGVCWDYADDRDYYSDCVSRTFPISQEMVNSGATLTLSATNEDNVFGGYTLYIGYNGDTVGPCPSPPPPSPPPPPPSPVCPSVRLSHKWLPPNGKLKHLRLTVPHGTTCKKPQVRITQITTDKPLPPGRTARPVVAARYSSAWASSRSLPFSLAAFGSGTPNGGRTYFVTYEVRCPGGVCRGEATVCVPDAANKRVCPAVGGERIPV